MSTVLEKKQIQRLMEKSECLKSELVSADSKKFIDELIVFIEDCYSRFSKIALTELFGKIVIAILGLLIASNSPIFQ